MDKICAKCGFPKPLIEFVKNRKRSDGHGPHCLSCNREYMRSLYQKPGSKYKASSQQYYSDHKENLNEENRRRWKENKEQYRMASDKWRQENRGSILEYYQRKGSSHRELLNSLKEGRPCTDCGGSFPPFCMEYDHVRGEKRFALGKMANHTWAAILAELAKCELVCCACHRVRTQSRKGDTSIPKLLAFHEWINSLKTKPCTDCGHTFPSVAMDFDHKFGEKISGIAQMWSWGRDRVLAELAKCELVCANCHRIRTQVRRDSAKFVREAA